MLALLVLLLQAPPDPVDRLLSELKSPSKERQEIARLALRAYGGSVVDRLKKAEVDLGFVGAEGTTKEDQEILTKVKSIRITIDMQNAPITAIVDYMREVSGLNFEVDRSIANDDVMVSFKVADIVLDGALRLMLGPRNCKYFVRGGKVRITPVDGPEELPSRWPVRVVPDCPQARQLVAGLSADAPDEREKTMSAFRRLGLAAETALWESLDSAEAETRSRSGELLRDLYRAPPPSAVSPLWIRLQGKEVVFKFEKASPARALEFLSGAAGVSVIVDARKPLPDWTISWGNRLKASDLLAFVAGELHRCYVVMDDWVLITPDPDRVLGTTPYGSTWTLPDEARKIEELVRSLAGDDPAAHEAALANLLERRPEVLGPLLEASRLLPPAAAKRCLAARERYVTERKYWLADEPSGAGLQTLTDGQRRFLDAPVDLVAVDEKLEEVLKKADIPARIRSGGNLRFHLWVKGLKREALLQALTGPNGLDFRLDGPTVVIDMIK